MLMVSYFSESDMLVFLHCFVLHLLSDFTVYSVFYIHWIIVLCYLETGFTHLSGLHSFDHYLTVGKLFIAVGHFSIFL